MFLLLLTELASMSVTNKEARELESYTINIKQIIAIQLRKLTIIRIKFIFFF